MTGQSTYSVKAAAAPRASRKSGIAALSVATIVITTSAKAIPQPDVTIPRPFTSVMASERQALVRRMNTDRDRKTEAVTFGLKAAAGLLMLAAMLRALRQRATPILVVSRARRRPSK
jgi:hypothetical protein